MMKRHVGTAVAVAVLLLSASDAFAQKTEGNPLAVIKTLKCRFPVYSVASWKGGEPQAQVKQGQQFSLEIDEIDAEGGNCCPCLTCACGSPPFQDATE